MKKCVNCGAENKDSQKFCSQCGEKLPDRTVENATIFCGGCGEPIAKGTPYCPYCGCKLNESGTPVVNTSTIDSGSECNPAQSAKANSHAPMQPPQYGSIAILWFTWDLVWLCIGYWILELVVGDYLFDIVIYTIADFLLSLLLLIPLRSYYKMALNQLEGRPIPQKKNGETLKDFVKEYEFSKTLFTILGYIFGIMPFVLALLLAFD
ncbi:MAG: zinc ribbon domain-containing protein [Clostridiales bacterium]|nr:zinc ribbon domain-containing protein [Clostridiales bacterium]